MHHLMQKRVLPTLFTERCLYGKQIYNYIINYMFYVIEKVQKNVHSGETMKLRPVGPTPTIS